MSEQKKNTFETESYDSTETALGTAPTDDDSTVGITAADLPLFLRKGHMEKVSSRCPGVETAFPARIAMV